MSTLKIKTSENTWEQLNTSETVTAISSSSTDAQVPSAKCINDNYRTATAQDVIDNSKEATTNKVTSISSSSTDAQYPSAKCVYDIIGDVESALAAL